MGQRVRETERKYEAAAGGHGPADLPELPDLSGLPGVGSVDTRDPVRLDAVYIDTPDLALAAHRRTLRRRTGGDDAGWHLKLPTAQADTRTEVRAPLGSAVDEPPPELLSEVAAVVRGRPLAPVVRLRTLRRPVLLRDAAGRTLAEIAYDEVAASVRRGAGSAAGGSVRPGSVRPVDSVRPEGRAVEGVTWTAGPAAEDLMRSAGSAAEGPQPTEDSAWTEVEVELRDGDAGLLDAVEERFQAAGLRRSRSSSKLARALGDRLVPLPRPPDPVRTAGQVATAYLHTQLTALLTLDPAVRRAEEDAVHRMRVATRRARSALRSFRRELDAAVTDPLGGELKWLAGVLGLERDREVLADRLARRLAELDASLVSAQVRRRVAGVTGADGVTGMTGVEGAAGAAGEPRASGKPGQAPPSGHSGAHAAAHAAVVRELNGPRYFALLDALESLLAAPPFRPAADAPAAPAAARAVRRDHARLRARVEAALALPPGDDRDTALHEARKAAKRARYSSEAAEVVLGAPAADHTTRMKSVQQLLGEHQDSVMCRRTLADLRDRARAAGEDRAPYQAMRRRERALAADVAARLPEVWRAADRTV